MSKPTSVFNNDHLQVSTNIMRALAHPLRMKIIGIIDNNQSANVNQIYEHLNIEQSIASQHLRVLRQADLVSTRRDGKFVYYSLNYDKIDGAGRIAGGFSELLTSD